MAPGMQGEAAAPTLDALFLELASPHRLRFLLELRQAPRGASQLAKLSGVSVQEGMRHLGRLQELHLVQRRGDREYVLTSLGQAICATFPYSEALMRHADFVLGHDLSWLPQHIRATDLLQAPRSHGPESEHIMAQEQVTTSATRLLCRAADQLFWHVPSRMAPPAPEGRTWNAVYTPSVVTNERFFDIPKVALQLRAGAPMGRWRVTVVRELPFMLTVTETEGVMFLRDTRGKLDFSEMVRSSDPAFRDWAVAVFRHFEAQGVVAFDATRGDRLEEWRERMLDAAKRVAAPGPQ
ncbi:MAG: hypothetical protein LC624_09425 [Halobacteriales archaeon]|nr:hypothetical protein [Halobacteriales archaeon]